MAITQNDLQILKAEVMADTDDGGGLPTANTVTDGVSNNLFPDVSDIDRMIGRVRLRKVFLGVQTANRDLLQAARLIFTELPDNPDISVFAFKATSFADRRSDAQNKIESYLAFGTKWAGHLLETQLAGQRVIQISLDKGDQVPAVGQPLVIVQNEGQSDEFYQYIRPLKVDTTERRFQRTVSETVTRTVVTIEFGDTLNKTFNGLTVPEFYQNTSTSRRAILREARVADAAKYYSASKLAEPVVAMQSRQVRLNSIYTQVVPSTQVETPILQRDPANQVATQARGDGTIEISQSVNIATNTAFSLPSGIAVGTLSIGIGYDKYTDRDGELIDRAGKAIASIKYGTGQITWYDTAPIGQHTISGSYKPASEFTRVAQTDYQIVGDNAGYNYVRELGAEPAQGSLKITYSVGGNNYLVHDDGRGNLIDDEGNGRGTVQGKTVLLTTAAIPDAASYILYSFGVDLDTVKFGEQVLPDAYHTLQIDHYAVGNVVATWGVDKTATIGSSGATGDAKGELSAKTVYLAPKVLIGKDADVTLTYYKATPSELLFKHQEFPDSGAKGELNYTGSLESAIHSGFIARIDFGRSDLEGSVHFELVEDASGTGLKVGQMFQPYSYYDADRAEMQSYWKPLNNGSSIADVEIVSSYLNKATGAFGFNINVTKTKSTVDVITRPGVSPVFKTKTITYKHPFAATEMNVSARSGGGSEQVIDIRKAGDLHIDTPVSGESPIAPNSLIFNAFGNTLVDNAGAIKKGTATVGSVDYQSGVINITDWTTGATNSVSLLNMLRENDPVPLANLIFRTPVAPLKKASLQISAELADGTVVSLSTDEQGSITGHSFAHGTVDFKAGVVALYFYEKLGVTANPDVVNEPWYDINNIYTETATGATQFINRPVYVKPDSIRYNAIAYSYLPLDKELIGLDPVRLPSDGRVPFVRKGDSIAITEAKTMALPTNAVGDSFNLGFERLSDISVTDSLGARVNDTWIDADLDAGTLTLNSYFDVSQLAPPLTAKYRIMDMALCIETDISGRVTLSTPITHDYSTNAVFSSMLIAGDMQARVFNTFSQKSWTGVFSDALIGDRATAQLQTANNPIVVTNEDAITERWALVFTSVTSFNIIGETLGQIGSGDINTLTAPINPMTNKPYFTIPIAAWGLGWSANNVVRLNTDAPKYPVWIGNAIGQHEGSSSDNYDFTIGYHANIDRDRVTV